MDASAYLQKQGWRGDGHSLDHSDRGIKKPLLVSKKVDVLGVGLNKHQAVSDQWWLRAFDQGLKTFGTGQESALGAVQKHGVNRGGLYARFTQGEGVPGSIGQSPVAGSEAGTGANTPIETQLDRFDVDKTPRDKRQRNGRDKKDRQPYDATMPLLQNLSDAPAGMQKQSDKKRKRTPKSEEKRIRRKVEHDGMVHCQHAKRTVAGEERLEAHYQDEKGISRQAKEYVLEAQRRGIIPVDTKKTRKFTSASGVNGTSSGPSADFVDVMSRAGLDAHVPYAASGSTAGNAPKSSCEKMKRRIKRAAKAYLSGEEARNEGTVQERRAKKADKKTRTVAAMVTRDDGSEEIKQRKAMVRTPPKALPEGKKTEGKERLSSTKLQSYTDRARLKGVGLEEYIRRRDAKTAAKRARKMVDAAPAAGG